MGSNEDNKCVERCSRCFDFETFRHRNTSDCLLTLSARVAELEQKLDSALEKLERVVGKA